MSKKPRLHKSGDYWSVDWNCCARELDPAALFTTWELAAEALAVHKCRFWNRLRVVRAYLLALMLVLAVVAYTLFTTPVPSERPAEQQVLSGQVPDAAPAVQGETPTATAVGHGEALAHLVIPRFGDSWMWTVSEGVEDDVLEHGPGHYPGTALPGEVGNMAIAGHRSTHGDPFLDFDRLRVGDEIRLSQGETEWVYEVTVDPKIVPENSGWLLDTFAEGRWLTLTTCWPKYGSDKRMYVRAELVSTSQQPLLASS